MPYKDIDKKRESVRLAYHHLRDKLYAKKGGVCRDCGSEGPLDVHHLIERKKERRRKSKYAEYRRLLRSPEKYALLCALCHMKETMAYVRSFRSFIKIGTLIGTPKEKAPLI